MALRKVKGGLTWPGTWPNSQRIAVAVAAKCLQRRVWKSAERPAELQRMACNREAGQTEASRLSNSRERHRFHKASDLQTMRELRKTGKKSAEVKAGDAEERRQSPANLPSAHILWTAEDEAGGADWRRHVIHTLQLASSVD